MENPKIEIAKKYFGKHFLNNFKLINNWDEMPKVFRPHLFETSFLIYKRSGDFLFVQGPEESYLVYITPDETIIIDSTGEGVSEFKVETELNIGVISLTLKDIISYLKNKEQKVDKLTESDIIRLIKKIKSL